jgi:hypothetical protein
LIDNKPQRAQRAQREERQERKIRPIGLFFSKKYRANYCEYFSKLAIQP